MAKPAQKVETIKKSDRRWQSDVIVDMIKRYGFEYISLNPGASYRGPARFAGQLRGERSADAALPA